MAAANIVIVPYYSQQEIDRYLKIAEHILAVGRSGQLLSNFCWRPARASNRAGA